MGDPTCGYMWLHVRGPGGGSHMWLHIRGPGGRTYIWLYLTTHNDKNMTIIKNIIDGKITAVVN